MKEIIKNGLEGFRRDTSYVNVYETLFAEQYSREDIPNLMVIPYSNNEKFLMDTARITNYNTGYVLPLFEACAPYDSYLGDLDHQQLVNLKDIAVLKSVPLPSLITMPVTGNNIIQNFNG